LLNFYFYKKIYSTKNVELAMWVWVVWGKCGKMWINDTEEVKSVEKCHYGKKKSQNSMEKNTYLIV